MGNEEIKTYPEIGKDYKHYKGGRYTVLTMAKHSESDKIKETFDKLELMSDSMSEEAFKLIGELEKCLEDNLVIYRSIHFGSVHARPLHMWFEKVREDKPMNPSPLRFEEIK